MWIRRIQYLFVGITIITVFLVGILFTIQGVKPELLSGFVDNARKNTEVAGREIVNTPTVEQQDFVQAVYNNEENFQSFEALKEQAALEKAEILRGFVAMPETPSSKRLYLPIYEGVSPHVLSIGAGVGRQNREMGKGNFPIFAHNMGNGKTFNPTYFSTLQTMNDSVLGYPIYLSNGENIYTYKIESLDPYVERSKTEIMDEREGDTKVLLVACQEDAQWWATFYQTGNTYAAYRIVLTATLTESISFKNAPQNLKDCFPDLVSQRVVVNEAISTITKEGNLTNEKVLSAKLLPDKKMVSKMDQAILASEANYKPILFSIAGILSAGNLILSLLKKVSSKKIEER